MKIYSKIVLLSLASAVAGSAVTTLAVNRLEASTDPATTVEARASQATRGSLFTVGNGVTPPTDFTQAAEQTINGVVSVKNYAKINSRSQAYGGGGSPFGLDPFEFFFGVPRQRQQQPDRGQDEPREAQRGMGSGVIISEDGYIVTNNHVVEGADRLEVALNDNTTYDAEVVGADPSTDLALLKIPAEGLHVIPMGDSEALRVGEWVLAVGNPFGFTSTVTTGIVSAKARGVGANRSPNGQMNIESYIQTDAAVNPGNSGGALVNINGELVGINAAIYSQTGNYAGCSFAIPSSIVSKVVSDLRQYGQVQRAMLGLSFRELDAALAKEKGITATNEGIYVAEVMDQSAAREAGLKEGDVIVALGGQPTHSAAQLQGEMAKYSPGDKVEVAYIRDNEQHTASVTFRNSRGTMAVTRPADSSALGCSFTSLSDEQKEQLRLSAGVQVGDLSDGVFKDAGVRNGFIILEINNARVRSKADVENIYKAIMEADEADKVMFVTGLYPSQPNRRVYYAVPLSDD